MRPPQDPPKPRVPVPPTIRMPAAQVKAELEAREREREREVREAVPRFTPPPAPPGLDPPKRPFEATMAELAPTEDLPWLDGPRPQQDAFQLVRVVDGFAIARHVFTHGLIRVGRGEDCDLRLEDPLVSRYHALIERQPTGEFAVHDQQSSNGLKVNGKRVERSCLLHDGDVLLLGTTRLVFQAGLAGDLAFPIAPPAPVEHRPDHPVEPGPAPATLRRPIPPTEPMKKPAPPPPSARLAKPAPGSARHEKPATPPPSPSGRHPKPPTPPPARLEKPPTPPPARHERPPTPPPARLEKPPTPPPARHEKPAPGSARHEKPPTPPPARLKLNTAGQDALALNTPPDAPARAPATAAFWEEAPSPTPANARAERPWSGGGADPDAPPAAPPPDSVLAQEPTGHTLVLGTKRQQDEQREAGVGIRAYLQPTVEERWSAAAGRADEHHLIARDAFVIGAGDDVDLKVEGRLMPRVIAVIVRGLSGFSIHAVTGWPWTSKVNGRVVVDSEDLDDEDVLDLGGSKFIFRRGLPPT